VRWGSSWGLWRSSLERPGSRWGRSDCTEEMLDCTVVSWGCTEGRTVNIWVKRESSSEMSESNWGLLVNNSVMLVSSSETSGCT